MDTIERTAVMSGGWAGSIPGYDALHPVDRKRIDFIYGEVGMHFGRSGFAGRTLLDCGCGSGGFTGGLAGMGMRVLGIDLNRSALRKAAAAFGGTGRCAYACANAYDVDNLVRDGSLDAVLCSEILEHVHKPDIILGYLHRKLKPGGLLICCVPNGSGPSETGQALRTALRWLPQTVLKSAVGLTGLWGVLQCRRGRELYPEGGHVKYYDLGQWTRLIDRSGFTLRRYACSIGWPGFLPLTLKLRGASECSCRTIDSAPAERACGFFISSTKPNASGE